MPSVADYGSAMPGPMCEDASGIVADQATNSFQGTRRPTDKACDRLQGWTRHRDTAYARSRHDKPGQSYEQSGGQGPGTRRRIGSPDHPSSADSRPLNLAECRRGRGCAPTLQGTGTSTNQILSGPDVENRVAGGQGVGDANEVDSTACSQ